MTQDALTMVRVCVWLRHRVVARGFQRPEPKLGLARACSGEQASARRHLWHKWYLYSQVRTSQKNFAVTVCQPGSEGRMEKELGNEPVNIKWLRGVRLCLIFTSSTATRVTGEKLSDLAFRRRDNRTLRSRPRWNRPRGRDTDVNIRIAIRIRDVHYSLKRGWCWCCWRHRKRHFCSGARQRSYSMRVARIARCSRCRETLRATS